MKQSTAILLSSVRRRLVQIPTAALTLPKRSVITLPQPTTSDVAFPTPPLNTLHPELLHASQIHPPSESSSSPSSSSSFQTSSSSGPFIDISSNASPNSSSPPPSSHSNHPYAGQHVQPTSAPALVEPLNLPRPPHSPPRSKEFHPHPFDTHSIVKHLEKSTIESGVARELMLATRALVIARTEKARDQLMSKEDMENQAYLFRAALSELRTVLSLRTRNEEATRRSLTMITEREVESLDVRIKESMEQLKHDIEIELENRKADTRVEQKAYEIAIEELNNKFTISLGDLRTDIEQYKWDTTRKGIVGIAIFVLFIVGSTTLLTEFPPTTPPAPAPPPLSTSSSSFQSCIW
ncbi:Protein of unknown function DUF1640 [Phaffia rhodozyma]|uniref:Uncharacterized protein n=1 Tax=Phaffia rhodozyma TaxID=264483 RepID=A0A0F7SVZ2_PHARH|nr:Protein of unknown function DUF1640 [Phaffia rhodozyma]